MLALVCDAAPDGELPVAGCVLGSGIAVHAAHALGVRVKGLVLVSPTPVEPDTRFLEGLSRLRDWSLYWTAEQLSGLAQLMLYPGNPRFARTCRILERMLVQATGPSADRFMLLAEQCCRISDLLPKLRCEIVTLFGEKGVNPLYGPELIPAWREAVGDSRVTVLQDAADVVPMERPDAVAAMIRRFVAS